MHDDVAGVDQHPVALRQSLDGNPFEAAFLESLPEVFCNGADLALRGAAGDDQEIGDVGLAGETDDDDVSRLVVIQGFFHQLEHVRRGRWLLFLVCYGLLLLVACIT